MVETFYWTNKVQMIAVSFYLKYLKYTLIVNRLTGDKTYFLGKYNEVII